MLAPCATAAGSAGAVGGVTPPAGKPKPWLACCCLGGSEGSALAVGCALPSCSVLKPIRHMATARSSDPGTGSPPGVGAAVEAEVENSPPREGVPAAVEATPIRAGVLMEAPGPPPRAGLGRGSGPGSPVASAETRRLRGAPLRCGASTLQPDQGLAWVTCTGHVHMS